MNARRWIGFLLPDALSMHADWLRPFAAGDGNLLARLLRSRTARLLLTKSLYKTHEIAVPERINLQPHQQWLLADHEAQRALAQSLGRDALHEQIRKTVRASAVALLRSELGEADYARALDGPGLMVEGLDRAAFDAALERRRLKDYFVAVGASLLETAIDDADPFCRLRMRFAFSPNAWQSRPRGIRGDANELARRIAEATTGE